MTDVHATKNVHLDEAPFREIEALASNSQPKENPSQPGLALHQVFDQDVLDEFLSQTVESEVATLSLWERILSLFKRSEKAPTSQVSPSESVEASTATKLESISPTPALEPPAHIPEDLQRAKFSTASKKGDFKAKLTSSEIEEGLALMSDKTIESIMFIIFKVQIELEKKSANVAESTYSKYLDFQKMQQEVLLDIKEALAQDENLAKRFAKVEYFAWILSGIATFAVASTLLGPFWSFLSTATAAGLTATTLGGKAYFTRLMNEHKADHERYMHDDQYYGDRVEDSRHRLMATAEADSVFKERWIQLLRRTDKMRKIVFKRR